MCDVNPFGVVALQAAYNEGEEWLECLNAYLYKNYQVLKTFFQEHLSRLEVLKLEGTYLVWIDISSTGLSASVITDLLLKQAKVLVNKGDLYGKKAGDCYIRLNIAMPQSLMIEALQRMEKVLRKV